MAKDAESVYINLPGEGGTEKSTCLNPKHVILILLVGALLISGVGNFLLYHELHNRDYALFERESLTVPSKGTPSEYLLMLYHALQDVLDVAVCGGGVAKVSSTYK